MSEPAPVPAEENISIKTPQDLFEWVSVALGRDPKQIQSMAKFMDIDSHDETSYFPNQLTSLAIAQLRGYGKAHYPETYEGCYCNR